MPKPTEEQIIRILNTVARKYSKRWGGKFEVDELVNQVWLMGEVQQMPDIRLVWGRAKYDMIDYMRAYSTWRYRGIPRNADLRKNRKHFTFPDNRMEAREQIDCLTTSLNRKETLVIKLFAEGFFPYEVAKVLGFSEAWVCWLVQRKKGNLQQLLKERYILQKSE